MFFWDTNRLTYLFANSVGCCVLQKSRMKGSNPHSPAEITDRLGRSLGDSCIGLSWSLRVWYEWPSVEGALNILGRKSSTLVWEGRCARRPPFNSSSRSGSKVGGARDVRFLFRDSITADWTKIRKASDLERDHRLALGALTESRACFRQRP